MRFLRFNTATRLSVGPFFDKTDGITPKTALTVTNEKLTLVIDESNVPTLVLDTAPTASGGSNDMVHVSGDDAGIYDLELAAADTNHLGRGILSLTDANNHCPVFHEVMVIPQKVYDSIVLGTDNLEIDAVQLLGTAWATPGTAGTPDVNVLALSTAAILSIWHQALAQISTASTIGKLIKDYLDAAISTRLASASYTTPPTGAAIADAICDEVISTGHSVANSLGKITYDNVNAPIATVDTVVDAIKAKTDLIPANPAAVGSKMDIADSPSSTGVAVIVAAIWDKLTSGITTTGSIGKLIKDYLDAAISTRLASASYTAPPTAVQNRQEMDSNSTKLANLDAAVTTRAAASTALSTSVWTSGRAALLDFLDALVSSRLASASYTAPPTVGAIADQVWDEQMSGHTTTGSAGKALSNASAPSVSEIDAQLSGNHGAGAWGASAVGTIAYPDPEEPFLENGNPMVGVKVEAFSNSARTALVDAQITDVNGNFQFHLNAGTYWFRASNAGHSNYEWSVVLE
jgi:hypothetical protein